MLLALLIGLFGVALALGLALWAITLVAVKGLLLLARLGVGLLAGWGRFAVRSRPR